LECSEQAVHVSPAEPTCAVDCPKIHAIRRREPLEIVVSMMTANGVAALAGGRIEEI
jgi:hypothetical protein